VPRQTDDVNWIPVVGALGLVVTTGDKLSQRAEWDAFKVARLRVIRIAARSDQSVWDTVQLLGGPWQRIVQFVAGSGPGSWLAVIDGAGALRMRTPSP